MTKQPPSLSEPSSKDDTAAAVITTESLASIEQFQLKECAFDKWYTKFEKISVESVFLKIPENVLNYLRDDKFILPKECIPKSNYLVFDEANSELSSNVNINNSVFTDDDLADNENMETLEFPEFSQQLKDIIKNFDQSVFIKTNWHCPKDAFWITLGQTLQVKDIADVYQLLKASNIIANDVCSDNDANTNYPKDIDHFLVIKRWQEINSGTEFRCFVKNRNLVAISPRYWPQYYEHILSQKSEIMQDIISMFKEHIKHKFTLDNFAFDIVRSSKDHVYLLDFSPLNPKYTDLLAFKWEEIEEFQEDKDDPEFRYIATDFGIQPNKRNNYGIPQDIADLFSNSSSLVDSAISITDVLAQRVQQELIVEGCGM